MVETTLTNNINVSNVMILLILNGIVLFTHAEPVIKLHPDMHPRHVKDAFTSDGICSHDDIDGYNDGNLTGEC
jgi:hypothetical protein